MSKICVEEWVLPINAILYSRDRLHRIKLERPLTFENNPDAGCEYVICIRSIEEDKIGGSVTFKMNDDNFCMNKIEDKGKSIFNTFLNSLVLKGYTCQELSYGELKCINCVKGKIWTVSKSVDSSFKKEGRSCNLPKEDYSDIQDISKNLTSEELTALSDSFKGNRKQSSFLIVEFISLWIEFNDLYNSANGKGKEMCRAAKYLKKFTDDDHKILFERNRDIIVILSELDLHSQNKQENYSKSLLESLATPERSHYKIIYDAICCVYAIRNSIFHSNKAPNNFKCWKLLNNFLFDIVHHEQICRLYKFGISTLHDIPSNAPNSLLIPKNLPV